MWAMLLPRCRAGSSPRAATLTSTASMPSSIMDRSSAAWGRCHSGDNDTKPSRAHTLAAAVGCCVEQEKQLCTYVFDAGALVIAGNSATGDRLYVVFGLHVGKQGSHVFHLVVGKAPRVHEGIGAAGAVDASAVEGYAHGRGVCVQDAVADGLIHVAVQIVHLVTGGQEVGERHNWTMGWLAQTYPYICVAPRVPVAPPASWQSTSPCHRCGGNVMHARRSSDTGSTRYPRTISSTNQSHLTRATQRILGLLDGEFRWPHGQLSQPTTSIESIENTTRHIICDTDTDNPAIFHHHPLRFTPYPTLLPHASWNAFSSSSLVAHAIFAAFGCPYERHRHAYHPCGGRCVPSAAFQQA